MDRWSGRLQGRSYQCPVHSHFITLISEREIAWSFHAKHVVWTKHGKQNKFLSSFGILSSLMTLESKWHCYSGTSVLHICYRTNVQIRNIRCTNPIFFIWCTEAWNDVMLLHLKHITYWYKQGEPFLQPEKDERRWIERDVWRSTVCSHAAREWIPTEMLSASYRRTIIRMQP